MLTCLAGTVSLLISSTLTSVLKEVVMVCVLADENHTPFDA